MRRRWPVPVFFVVLAASVAYGLLGPKASTVTGATYGLYTVAVQADRLWSLLALAAVEAGVVVNVIFTTTGKDGVATAFSAGLSTMSAALTWAKGARAWAASRGV